MTRIESYFAPKGFSYLLALTSGISPLSVKAAILLFHSLLPSNILEVQKLSSFYTVSASFSPSVISKPKYHGGDATLPEPRTKAPSLIPFSMEATIIPRITLSCLLDSFHTGNKEFKIYAILKE